MLSSLTLTPFPRHLGLNGPLVTSYLREREKNKGQGTHKQTVMMGQEGV